MQTTYVSFEVQFVRQRQRRMRAGGVRGSRVAKRSRALSSWRITGEAAADEAVSEAEVEGSGRRSAASRVLASAFVRQTSERAGRRRRSAPAHTVKSSDSSRSSRTSCIAICNKLMLIPNCDENYVIFYISILKIRTVQIFGVMAKEFGRESNMLTSSKTIAAAIEHSIGGSSVKTYSTRI